MCFKADRTWLGSGLFSMDYVSNVSQFALLLGSVLRVPQPVQDPGSGLPYSRVLKAFNILFRVRSMYAQLGVESRVSYTTL